MRTVMANMPLKFLALGLAILLWGVANTSSSIERGFDIPVVLRGVPQDLVVTGLSADQVNVRISGSRAQLRNFGASDRVYEVDVAGAQVGESTKEVDLSGFDLPRGARIVSRSPSRVEFNLARKGSRTVRIRADIEGKPAPGFTISKYFVTPATVRITGARSEVLRMREAVTETVVIDGAEEDINRDVRLSLGGRYVWLEEPTGIRLSVKIVPNEKSSGYENKVND